MNTFVVTFCCVAVSLASAGWIPSGSVGVSKDGALIAGPSGSIHTNNGIYGHGAGARLSGPSGNVGTDGGHAILKGPGIGHDDGHWDNGNWNGNSWNKWGNDDGEDDGQWHGDNGQWHGEGDDGQWHGDNEGQWNGDNGNDGQWNGDDGNDGQWGKHVIVAPIAVGGWGHGWNGGW